MSSSQIHETLKKPNRIIDKKSEVHTQRYTHRHTRTETHRYRQTHTHTRRWRWRKNKLNKKLKQYATSINIMALRRFAKRHFQGQALPSHTHINTHTHTQLKLLNISPPSKKRALRTRRLEKRIVSLVTFHQTKRSEVGFWSNGRKEKSSQLQPRFLR